jgi:hypothetical protein
VRVEGGEIAKQNNHTKGMARRIFGESLQAAHSQYAMQLTQCKQHGACGPKDVRCAVKLRKVGIRARPRLSSESRYSRAVYNPAVSFIDCSNNNYFGKQRYCCRPRLMRAIFSSCNTSFGQSPGPPRKQHLAPRSHCMRHVPHLGNDAMPLPFHALCRPSGVLMGTFPLPH